mgnify:FL=1
MNLNMEDHRQENYVKPKVPVKAFTGEGHTLGRLVVVDSRFHKITHIGQSVQSNRILTIGKQKL